MSLNLDLIYSQFNFKVDKSNKSKIYEFEKFRLDAVHLMLYHNGEEIPLVPKAVETLLALVEKRGEILSKDELMETIWTDSVVEESNLAQYLHLLRKTLGKTKDGKPFIETFRRRGYRFNGEVHAGDFSTEIKQENVNQNILLHPGLTDGGVVKKATSEKVVALADWRHEPEANVKPTQTILPVAQIFPATEHKRVWLVGAIVFGLLILALGFFAFTRFTLETPTNDAPIKTIAVLPFKPLVADNRDEVLEMGMADTLIARLGNNRKIIVRPLSSVRKFGNLEQDAIQAGRALNVESVLDGNIQRWGDKIRVNVRLIKTADGSSLWTGTFDEKFTDIFVVQDAISQRVATALALQLSGDEQARLEKRPTNNTEAYDFYLRGRFYAQKVTAMDLRKAIVFYQKAVDSDPNYALGLAGMADVYRTLAVAAFAPTKEVCPQAKQLAQRALEIDSSLAEAHIVLGWVGFLYDWDWRVAETELKKALEVAPNNSEAHRGYAHFLSIQGRNDEAVAEGRLARELDPLTLITNALEGQFLFYAGRDTEAIERLNKTLELDPNFWVAHNVLGRVYLRQGRFEEAVAELSKAKQLSGGSTEPLTQLGYALAKSGRRTEAEATIAELKSLATQNSVPAYNFAMIYNGLDEREEALNYLEKSYQEREAQLAFIKIDTRWNNLRSEPRFVDLVKRMNFE